MGKITSLVLLPGSGKTSGTSMPKIKAADEPSELVIKNILNYSRALKVEKTSKGKAVEYIAN